jgi:hypothetical protein
VSRILGSFVGSSSLAAQHARLCTRASKIKLHLPHSRPAGTWLSDPCVRLTKFGKAIGKG